MDMQIGFPNQRMEEPLATAGTDCVRLAEHRRHVFALIRDFQQAVGRPRGQRDAVSVLRAILPCSGAYFAILESLLDKLTGAGAAPHREWHRRILSEITESIDRFSAPNAQPAPTELAHALDALVVHEAAIRLRESCGH